MRTEQDHYQVSENVFNNLPSWERELWGEVREPFIKPYSQYPDSLAPVMDLDACFAQLEQAMAPAFLQAMTAADSPEN